MKVHSPRRLGLLGKNSPSVGSLHECFRMIGLTKDAVLWRILRASFALGLSLRCSMDVTQTSVLLFRFDIVPKMEGET